MARGRGEDNVREGLLGNKRQGIYFATKNINLRFLDRTCTHILAFEADGAVVFPGTRL